MYQKYNLYGITKNNYFTPLNDAFVLILGIPVFPQEVAPIFLNAAR